MSILALPPLSKSFDPDYLSFFLFVRGEACKMEIISTCCLELLLGLGEIGRYTLCMVTSRIAGVQKCPSGDAGAALTGAMHRDSYTACSSSHSFPATAGT